MEDESTTAGDGAAAEASERVPSASTGDPMLRRCTKVAEELLSMTGANLFCVEQGPNMPSLNAIADRMHGKGPAYGTLPDDFVEEMRRLWNVQRVLHPASSNMGKLARLLHAIFERLVRDWIVGSPDGREPLTLEQLASLPPEACSQCLGGDDQDNMVVCEVCDRHVHLDCFDEATMLPPGVRAARPRSCPRARAHPHSAAHTRDVRAGVLDVRRLRALSAR